MPEDNILDELEEISQLVEGGEEEKPVMQELDEIEKIAGAAAVKEVSEKEERKEEAKEEKKEEEKREEKKPEEKKTEEKKAPEERRPVPPTMPEKAIRGSGFKYASALLILLGVIIYGLAFYLRLNGWRIINYPPSSVVALAGTLFIIIGGEVYYRGLER